ncbi:hypothetical protein SFRURICE_020026 [Spodoptera frugiperda]|nr:hypothetical protein SFRURICE_020026 [Spodoptera frugiperda]
MCTCEIWERRKCVSRTQHGNSPHARHIVHAHIHHDLLWTDHSTSVPEKPLHTTQQSNRRAVPIT